MVHRRDLNAPPAQTMAQIVAALQEPAAQSKTVAAGVKHLGENGDVVWETTGKDGEPVHKSVKRFQVDLDDTTERQEQLAADLAASSERVTAAQDAVRELRETTLPGLRDSMTELDSRLSGTIGEAAASAHGAQDRADAAFELAQSRPSAEEVTAQITASANGKNGIRWSTSAPSAETPGVVSGDSWLQVDDFAARNVTGQWVWDGAAWKPVLIRSEVIAALDVAKLTAGQAALATAVVDRLFADLFAAHKVAAEQVDATSVAAAIGTFVKIDVGQIVGTSGDFSELVARKIASATAAFQEVYVQNLRTNSAAIDAAVIADLSASIITSGLLRTAPDGQRLELDSNGLTMYGVDPDGAEYPMVRLGPSEGSNLLTIGRSTIEPGGMSAPQGQFDTLLVAGRDVADMVADGARGVVGFMYSGDSSAWDGSGSEIKRLQAEAVLQPNRRYSITVDPHYIATRAAVPGMTHVERIRWRQGSGDVSVNDTAIASVRYFLANSTAAQSMPSLIGWIDTDQHSFGTNEQRCAVAYTMQTAGGTTDTRLLGRSPDYTLRLTIRDEGPSIQPTGNAWMSVGVPVSGAADAPAPVQQVTRYTKLYTSTGYWCLNSDGGNAGTPDVVHGLYPGGPGRFARYGGWSFPSMTGDLAGATIERVEMFATMNHAYYSAGATVNPGVWGGAKTSLSAVTSVYGWKPGTGRWITLPASTYSGFKSGAYTGVGFKPTSQDLSQYARFNAAAQLRITYRK